MLTAQVTAQVQHGEASGSVSAAEGAALLDGLAAAVAAVRAGSPLPSDLPAPLAGLFPSTVLTYLRTDDAIDPPTVAAQLPAGMPVLLSCSDADIQVACADVERPRHRGVHGRGRRDAQPPDRHGAHPEGRSVGHRRPLRGRPAVLAAAAPGHQRVDAAVVSEVAPIERRR